MKPSICTTVGSREGPSADLSSSLISEREAAIPQAPSLQRGVGRGPEAVLTPPNHPGLLGAHQELSCPLPRVQETGGTPAWASRGKPLLRALAGAATRKLNSWNLGGLSWTSFKDTIGPYRPGQGAKVTSTPNPHLHVGNRFSRVQVVGSLTWAFPRGLGYRRQPAWVSGDSQPGSNYFLATSCCVG